MKKWGWPCRYAGNNIHLIAELLVKEMLPSSTIWLPCGLKSSERRGRANGLTLSFLISLQVNEFIFCTSEVDQLVFHKYYFEFMVLSHKSNLLQLFQLKHKISYFWPMGISSISSGMFLTHLQFLPRDWENIL